MVSNVIDRTTAALMSEIERLDALDTSDSDAVAAECARATAMCATARQVREFGDLLVRAGELMAGAPAAESFFGGGAPALPETPAAWLASNAAGHSLSWARDRLGKRFGREFTFDEVRALVEEAGVELKDLTTGTGWQHASKSAYAAKERGRS